MRNEHTPIGDLKNIGSTSAQWLTEAGILTLADLEALGPIAAFQRVSSLGYPASLNLVYGLQAAILNTHWTDLPLELRESLRLELEKERQR